MYASPANRVAGPPPTSLARYGSAPGSLLASITESILSSDDFSSSSPALGFDPQMSRFFSPDSSSESTSPPNPLPYSISPIPSSAAAAAPVADPRPQLIRHSSSPAGFFSHLMVDNGYSVSMGIGNYSQASRDGVHAMANKRLQSQLSFSRQDSLSQISEISIAEIEESIVSGKNSDDVVAQAYMSGNYQLGSWDETNSIVFSAPPSKRVKDNNGDVIPGLNNIESQFSLPKTSLEMEKLLQSPQDYVPFKVRAKRGCATHPRSIAERERRTRISEKLRKLQEFVPNMDKQTNTTDMLELAVQHIKALQTQVQKLSEERANCKCGSKTEMH
ncbi:Myc-type basic helix-loop-helix (bHLH) domain-containing protein [Dioscorea alata]|uniref:Myc-type basic helix-loop-helix (BHLH) domain-containing protein n=1 Tax=Dioscorea alata TaxID=55571 RepID=A0ACB7W0X3_DIOAL|nr:Myc-type basic helix-loop-helix (bHLH) domain-containing protein [Dioscorea alata]